MTDPERMSNELSDGLTAPVREDRKLYRKPSFRSEQVFETMALQCGKISGTSSACNLVKMAS